jgi:hypothetical protein
LSRKALVRAAAIVIGAAIVEAAAAAVSYTLVSRGWMAEIRPASAGRAAAFAAHRSALFGWGPVSMADGRGVALAPRADPLFDAQEPACVSVYGDSFTAGSGVRDADTYPHQLSRRLGCRVANYGVGGYGDDQSLILERSQRALVRAPVLVLAHTAEDLLRNVSQYEPLLYPSLDEEPAFKPRFVMPGLRRIDAPAADEPSLRAFERNPDGFLLNDWFSDRPRRGFPYTLAIARWLLSDFHVRARIRGVPRYADFYDPAHPSNGLPLTVAILTAFAQEAEADGHRAYVLLIPTAGDVVYHARSGAWIDRPLADALAASGVRVVRAEMGGDPCHYYLECTGHLNARGNVRVAEILADALARDDVGQPFRAAGDSDRVRARSSNAPARPSRRPSS